MANENYIIVPSGLKPIHSLDMYGVLVDSWILGEEQVRLFEEVTRREQLDQPKAEKIVEDYRALNRGETWATGARKGEIINAIGEPIKRHPDLKPDYMKAVYPDGLDILREIYSAGEQALIFSTKKQGWINEYLVPLIGEVEIPLYEGNKSKPETFVEVYQQETAMGRRIITHTADELPEMEAAVRSGLFSGTSGRTIFVNRNNSITQEQARNAGIDMYVDKLMDVGYTMLVKKYI